MSKRISNHRRILPSLLGALFLTCVSLLVSAQNYPSLMWRISGNGLKKDSYLYGTMHVSGRTVFHLGDPFYDAIQKSDVVALELEPESWLHSMMSKPEEAFNWMEVPYDDYYGDEEGEYSLEGKFAFRYDVLSTMEQALSVTPSLLNYMLFRYDEFESTQDFEEDTWLDMHIYQCGKKMGKQTIGLETFEQTVYYGLKAEQAQYEEDAEEGSAYSDIDYGELENAYRRQDLDYIDSIDTYVDSKAFNQYILHARNEVFVHTMDSVFQTGQSLFAGMGCAHLPGEKGVIESLRRLGYTVEPMDKGSRNTRRRDKLERQIFHRKYQSSNFGENQPEVLIPDKAYRLACNDNFTNWVALDIPNGGSFSVYRIRTNAASRGINMQQQIMTLDSAIFEGVPGQLIQAKPFQLQGYRAWDIYNQTTRDDVHRTVLVLMENELFVFKVTAGGDKIQRGYANEFFQSIQLPASYRLNSHWTITPDHSLQWKDAGQHVLYTSEDPLFSTSSLSYTGMHSSHSPVGFIRYTFQEMSYIEEDAYELRRLADAFMEDNALTEIAYRETTLFQLPAAAGAYQDADGQVYYARFYLKGLTYLAQFALNEDETRANEILDGFEWGIPQFEHWTVQQDSMQMMQVELPYQHMWPLTEELENPYMQYDWFQVFQAPGGDELIEVQITRSSEFADGTSRKAIFNQILEESKVSGWRTAITRMDSTEVGLHAAMTFSDTLSRRQIWNEVIIDHHTRYDIRANYDSIWGMGPFTKQFLKTFTPVDTLHRLDYFSPKDAAFMQQLVKADSTQINHIFGIIDYMDFELPIVPEIRTFLSRRSELKYTDAQWAGLSEALIYQLAKDTTTENLEFLKNLTRQYPDSGLYQSCILSTVAAIPTKSAQKFFHDRMMDEPPIVEDYFYQPQFLLHADSLPLVKEFLPDYFNLLSMDEYKWDILEVLSIAADSGYLKRSEYKTVVKELLISAKLELRRLKASKDLDVFALEEFQYLLSLLRPHAEDPEVASFFKKLRAGNHRAELLAVFDFDHRHHHAIADSLIGKMCQHPDLLFHAIIQLDSSASLKQIPQRYLSRDTLVKMMVATAFSEVEQTVDSVHLVDHFSSRIRSTPLDVYLVKFRVQQTKKTCGIVMAFDASNPQLLWPAFMTNGEIILEDESQAEEQLRLDWKALDRNSRHHPEFYYQSLDSMKAMQTDYY